MTPQVLVNGILLGGIYAAVGAGFSLVWGVLNIINIAHGASVMLGAYVTFFLFSRFGLDPFLTIPVSMLTLFVVGYVMQRALINRVIAHGSACRCSSSTWRCWRSRPTTGR
jgi:branched-chain amino acid transport system permease protein